MSIIKVNYLVLSLGIIAIPIETANGQNWTMTHLKNPTETCQQAVSGVKEYLRGYDYECFNCQFEIINRND
jgi:hypothetical protein